MLTLGSTGGGDWLASAPIFAALGDETRLSIVTKLSNGQPYSIARLTDGTDLTRQAVTKHLKVLEDAGLVAHTKAGRETLFHFRPEPIRGLQAYLDYVSGQWDNTLGRLKAFVEESPDGKK